MPPVKFLQRTGFVLLLLVLAARAGSAAPFERVPNDSLQMPLVPGGFGYTFTNAFPGLVFTNPVCIASPPGETNRLFVLEKSGRIIVITNLAAPTRSVFLDISARVSTSLGINDERGLLGLAFHPRHDTNGYFYVFYTGPATNGTSGLHEILSRFSTLGPDPNRGDTNSEVRLIAQYDEAGNHNGGDIHFGADGYLYASLGDEGNANDSFNNSQTITKDFFSAFLRLDVDKRPGSLNPNPHPAASTNYGVPPDNPFVGATNFNGLPVNSNSVRTEFWAVGLRNPWRWNFDPDTGRLYCGDVGQDAWEEVDLIERGGNYGWAYREGFANGPKAVLAPPGFASSQPLIAYPRSSGVAVTGGYVYRGQKIPQLYGAYIYADYGFGTIWALRHNGTNVTQNQVLFADPGGGVSAFGVDPANGDILYCDLQSGTDAILKRIIYNSTFTGTPIPPTLADTGAFTDVETLTVAPGIVGYDLNVPFWSDNAIKTRWFSVPNTNLAIGFSPDNNWSFPTGTVWIKHFELEITNGVPSSRKRLETRLLVFNNLGGYGVTYRWGDSTTNAELVDAAGLDEPITLHDNSGGVIATQVWHYPSRAQCLQCHPAAAGFALGFNTPQLNREQDYDGVVTNQIAALSLAGYFSNAVSSIHLLRALADATNEAVSLEYRVRSYLAANCVQCHRPDGTSQAFWDARVFTPGPFTGLIDGPLLNNLGDPANRVIAPGSLSHSVLLTRVANLGPGHMPPLATSVVNTQAVALLSVWITNTLPDYLSLSAWQTNYFGSTTAPGAAPEADPDGDGANNYLEYLTRTVPTNSSDAWLISITVSNDAAQISFSQISNRGFEVQAAGSLGNTGAWLPLDVPGNEPFFSSSKLPAVISDPLTATNRFYRVRVFEP